MKSGVAKEERTMLALILDLLGLLQKLHKMLEAAMLTSLCTMLDKEMDMCICADVNIVISKQKISKPNIVTNVHDLAMAD